MTFREYKNKNTGTYIYHSGKIISKSDNENLWEKTFKLYIQEDAILYDVNKKEYYTFWGNRHDKNRNCRWWRNHEIEDSSMYKGDFKEQESVEIRSYDCAEDF